MSGRPMFGDDGEESKEVPPRLVYHGGWRSHVWHYLSPIRESGSTSSRSLSMQAALLAERRLVKKRKSIILLLGIIGERKEPSQS